jgi:hypothetical protein
MGIGFRGSAGVDSGLNPLGLGLLPLELHFWIASPIDIATRELVFIRFGCWFWAVPS